MSPAEMQRAMDRYLKIKDDIDRYLRENYTGPKIEWMFEDGSTKEVAPNETRITDEILIELPR